MMFSKHSTHIISLVVSVLLMKRPSTKDVKFSFGGGGVVFGFKFYNKVSYSCPRMIAPTNNCSHRHLAPYFVNAISTWMLLICNPSDGELNTTFFLHSTTPNQAAFYKENPWADVIFFQLYFLEWSPTKKTPVPSVEHLGLSYMKMGLDLDVFPGGMVIWKSPRSVVER